MPFNMFFNRELKQGNKESLKDFMVYIASNLNEDNKKVLQDIWGSLGKVLREKNEVKEIIKESDPTFVNSEKKREKTVPKEVIIQREKDIHKLTANIINNIGIILGIVIFIISFQNLITLIPTFL